MSFMGISCRLLHGKYGFTNFNRKLKMMKTRIACTLIVGLFLLTGVASGQELQIRDGHFFKDGMLYTGTQQVYFDSGAIKLIRHIKDGVEHGKVTLFFENGKVSEERYYQMGAKDGLWVNYSEAGIRLAEASWKNGLKHGYWHVWDESGVKRYEMFYEEGRKAGTWYMWDEKGKLISEKKY